MAGRLIGVALDGNETAEKALCWAADHLYREGDTLVLIHCYTENVSAVPVLSDALEVSKAYKSEHERIDNLLGKYSAKIGSKKSHSIKCKIQGKIGETILQAAKSEKLDILVTGTRGLGPIKRAILSSVSDYLVKNATFPVCVYRDSAEY